jgi:hypothetical protein
MKKPLIVAGVVVLGVAGWLIFRPELLFIDRSVSEDLPSAQAGGGAETAKLASGSFHGVAHKTTGTASVHRLSNGKRILRFTDFETSNGPALQIYLVAAGDASDNETVTRAGFVTLGPIKGNIGNQNYDIPDEVDLSKYRAVTVWCSRFNVNFGTAPLAAVN